MKRYNISLAFAALFMAVSCNTSDKRDDYVSLSMLSYTFSGTTTDTVMIGVSSSVEWNCESDSDQFIAEKAGRDSARIISAPNMTGDILSGNIVFTAGTASTGFRVDRLPRHFEGSFVDYPPMSGGCISRNGKFAGYVNTEQIDGKYVYTAFRINLETGEIIEVQGIDQNGNHKEMSAISDDGRLYVVRSYNTYVFYDGEEIDMFVPEGYRGPIVESISADGSVLVGYLSDSQNLYQPVKWTSFGAECELLERPDDNAGGTGVYPGSMARGCSADGSVVYGSEWKFYGLIYWRDGRMFNPGIDYADISYDDKGSPLVGRIKMGPDVMKISPNGKYIAASYIVQADYAGEYPVLINTETGGMDFLEKVKGFAASAVTDDGLVFGYSPTFGMTTGCVLDFEGRKTIAISDWFKSEYGIHVGDDRIVMYHPCDNVFWGSKPVAGGTGMLYPDWHLVIK